MKYTLLGFSQESMLNLDLDYIDALLIRYFVDFKDTNKMRSEIVNGEPYYWVRYEAFIEEYPIIKISSKDRIYRRLKKLVDKGILKHTTIKCAGTYSYYALGENYIKLISNSEPSVLKPKGTSQKPEGYGAKNGGGTVQKPEGYGAKTVPNNPSTIYPSTINNPSTIYPSDKNATQVACSNKLLPIIEAWNSLNLNKVISVSGNRLTMLNARIKEYGIDSVLAAIENIKNSKWLQGQNDRGWIITFNWFIKPNNFIKVLEGTYKDKCTGTTKPSTHNKNKFNNFEQRKYDFDNLEKKLLGWDD